MIQFTIDHLKYDFRYKTFSTDVGDFLHFIRFKLPDNTLVFTKVWSKSQTFDLKPFKGKSFQSVFSKRPFCLNDDIDTSHHFCLLAMANHFFLSQRTTILSELILNGNVSESIRNRFSQELDLALEIANWEGIDFPKFWTSEERGKLKQGLEHFGYNYVVDVFI